MDIVIDFDGTCVEHAFPKIGESIGAASVLRDLIKEGHRLILFTMRSDNRKDGSHPLSGAIMWFKERNIPLYGINTNPTQSTWTNSPKAYGQLIIDDAALGCPLVYPEGRRPYADWKKIRIILEERRILPKK